MIRLWTGRSTDGYEQCSAILPSTQKTPCKIRAGRRYDIGGEKIAFIPGQVTGLWSQPMTSPTFLDPLHLAARALHQAIQDQENLRTDREWFKERTQMNQGISMCLYLVTSRVCGKVLQLIFQAQQLDHQAVPGLPVELGRVPQQDLCITGPREGAPWSASK